MNRLFFSGRNLQQALLAAARQFQLPPEEIAYTLRERQGGFIKNPRTVIEVDPASPRQAVRVAAPPRHQEARPQDMSPEVPKVPAARPAVPARSSPARERERPPEPQISPEAAVSAAKEAAALLARLAGLEVEARVSFEGSEGEIAIAFGGAGAERLAADQGELLDTMDHLLPRLVRGMTGASVPCRVDAAGFRAANEAVLRSLALEAAETVRREGRPHALPEMSPAERRIVHLTLETDASVTTASHGDGFLKSVTVSPA